VNCPGTKCSNDDKNKIQERRQEWERKGTIQHTIVQGTSMNNKELYPFLIGFWMRLRKRFFQLHKVSSNFLLLNLTLETWNHLICFSRQSKKNDVDE
jgi:hypothetical protein